MKKKYVKLIIIGAVAIVIGVIAYILLNGNNKKATETTNTSEVEYTVAKGNLVVSVSESGSVNPEDKRLIKSEINGTVDKIYVKEGDVVNKDQLIVSLESDAASGNENEINTIKLNIEKTQRDLNDLYNSKSSLNIYASISGVVSNLDLDVQDSVSKGTKLATIKDTNNSYIEVYYIKDNFDKVSIGDSASLFMSKYFTTVTGTVTDKDSTTVQMGGGAFGYKVTIKIQNPGGYATGDIAQVTINNSRGSFAGMQNGTIIAPKTENLIAEVAGKIGKLYTENGKYVNEGDIIASIEGVDLNFQIQEKQNTISKYQTQINNLVEGNIIYSPINGTVLSISVSDEEVVDRTTQLMTIADLNNMEIVIAVDELDINKIVLGQKASITSDVYKNERFTGTVSKISMEGKASSGVTTYDVTIKLDDRKNLMSGMNVDVRIIAEQKQGILIVPIDAVHRSQGQYMVTVKDASGNKVEKPVELGLATDAQAEIKSGLNEGDIVVYTKARSNAATSTNPNMMRPPGTGGGQRPGGTN